LNEKYAANFENIKGRRFFLAGLQGTKKDKFRDLSKFPLYKSKIGDYNN